ncbi:uncharacterized protein LOC143862069 [Tasmannia lanceolata]|uniref:uncharacterized protein LOC143862069 n=1 Tax=Tasmannia lanceolata TaxID=3420 RepID=UPI004063C5FE
MAPFGFSVPRVSAEVKKKVEKNPQIKEENDKNEGLFEFPLRVYCVSSMSKQQRLEMANQLKSELQQVRSLITDLSVKIPLQKPKKRKAHPVNSNENTALKKKKPVSNDLKDLKPKKLPTLSKKTKTQIRNKGSLPPFPLKLKRAMLKMPSDYDLGGENKLGVDNICSFRGKMVNNEDIPPGFENIKPMVNKEDCPPGFENGRPATSVVVQAKLRTARRVEGKFRSSNASSQGSKSPSSVLEIVCSSGEESERAKSVSATTVTKDKYCLLSHNHKKTSCSFESDCEKRFSNDSVDGKCYSALRSDLTNDNYYGGTNAFKHHLSLGIRNHVSSLHSHSVDAIIKAQKATPKHNTRWDMEKQSCKLGEFEQPQKEEMAQLLEKAKLAKAKNEQKLLKAESLIERKQKRVLDRNATSLALTEIQKTISMSATIEMKPKRKFEREAARLALQKMEDTISLYDDYKFLKDLEMLGIVQYMPTHSSLASEMNSSISHNDIGLFKPSERNPLEQLGLCMKIEEDDGYENDREEGEIYYEDDREEGEIYYEDDREEGEIYYEDDREEGEIYYEDDREEGEIY